jgi:hypothetical protein
MDSTFALTGEPLVDDWSVLVAHGQSMLFCGPQEATEAWFRTAIMLLSRPIHRVACEKGLALTPDCATLVLDNLDALDLSQQHQVLRWLNDPLRVQTQVISFTTTPLYPQVQQGAFLTDLYYRLNVFYFEIRVA